MLAFFLLLAAEAPIVVITREPHPAIAWTETVSGSCGRHRLEIRRTRSRSGVSTRLLIDGKRARGNTGRLERELGNARAAYRFSLLCSPDGRDPPILRWVRGLADGHGSAAFRSGAAAFRRGAIVRIDAEDSNAESFWYR